MIKSIQTQNPQFIKQYYDQIPKRSMKELSEWLLAATQARDNLTRREVLFEPPKMSMEEALEKARRE